MPLKRPGRARTERREPGRTVGQQVAGQPVEPRRMFATAATRHVRHDGDCPAAAGPAFGNESLAKDDGPIF
jgi:hypothetical protein